MFLHTGRAILIYNYSFHFEFQVYVFFVRDLLPTNLFNQEEDSVPVRAPPTEAPEVELDEYSGHMTPTEANGEILMTGQDESMSNLLNHLF